MLRSILTLLIGFSLTTGFAQDATDWTPYFSNEELSITVRYEDCHYPEKGVDNRYLFLKLENLTNQTITVNYNLDRSYNGKELNPDIKLFEFSIPANSLINGQCTDLINGLHLFSRMLKMKEKSTLSHFELSNLVINGKNVAR